MTGEQLVAFILMRRVWKCIVAGKHRAGHCKACGIHKA